MLELKNKSTKNNKCLIVTLISVMLCNFILSDFIRFSNNRDFYDCINSVSIINHNQCAVCSTVNSTQVLDRKELRFKKEQDLLLLFLKFLVTTQSLAPVTFST